eukprot:TRINITY_DN8908_c1_g1_i1.p1 TRINITY_DN8908_c1_g1~~TRINITY_DN8908_c1_g1_i1.p1  ORF type:complete len:512 (-),score=41.64 TRINITY_DN8908_c1_g1_i1:3201-4736(-)
MLDNIPQSSDSPTRIAVSGIPWETSDADFKRHFMQFGEVEYAEVIRDRQGRSKGIGFVAFSNPDTARMVLSVQHVLDHRRIEVKVDSRDVNRNRVFVARIPDTLSETEFRNYFEQFGRVQDAYMPRDHTKQGYRGIGFVTYDDAESVDRVIKLKHVIKGVEVAVDLAIIKGDIMRNTPNPVSIPSSSNDYAVQQLQRGLLSMNIGGGQAQTGYMSPPPQQPLQNIATEQAPSVFSFSEESFSPTSTGSGGFIDQNNRFRGAHYLQQQQLQQHPQMHALGARLSPHVVPQHYSNPHSGPSSPIPPPQADYLVLQQVAQGQMPLSSQGSDVVDNPGPANARAGPRIFIGKLSKDTTEQDVREYFQSFGFVLDVYMPKNKDNKKEHRGFGFVTFETEASIKRVVSHGMHKIRGANIAIDVAVPRKEDALRPLSPTSPTSPTGVMSPQPGMGPMDRLPVDLSQIMGGGTQSPDANVMALSQQGLHMQQHQYHGGLQHLSSMEQQYPHHSYQGYER